MFKTVVSMLLAVSAGTIGDILLAKGMKGLGNVSTMTLRGFFAVGYQALTTPKLVIGTDCWQSSYFSGWQSSPGRIFQSPC